MRRRGFSTPHPQPVQRPGITQLLASPSGQAATGRDIRVGPSGAATGLMGSERTGTDTVFDQSEGTNRPYPNPACETGCTQKQGLPPPALFTRHQKCGTNARQNRQVYLRVRGAEIRCGFLAPAARSASLQPASQINRPFRSACAWPNLEFGGWQQKPQICDRINVADFWSEASQPATRPPPIPMGSAAAVRKASTGCPAGRSAGVVQLLVVARGQGWAVARAGTQRPAAGELHQIDRRSGRCP